MLLSNKGGVFHCGERLRGGTLLPAFCPPLGDEASGGCSNVGEWLFAGKDSGVSFSAYPAVMVFKGEKPTPHHHLWLGVAVACSGEVEICRLPR